MPTIISFIALGSTSFVERLPDGDIIKSPWPGLDGAVERRRELALESQIYDRLGEHPRLVKKKAWDSSDHTLVLEFMPNGTLKEYLIVHPEVSLPQRLRWIEQAAEGIHLLHSSGVVHCDAGPQNILLDADLNLRISDFGGSSLDESKRHSPRDSIYGP